MDKKVETNWVRLRASIFLRDLVISPLKDVSNWTEDYLTNDELHDIKQIIKSIKEIRKKIEQGCKP